MLRDYDQVNYVERWTDLSFISGTLCLNAIIYSAILSNAFLISSVLNNTLKTN
jgi:hypothetical protein